jgi:cation diffusion facilitator family transporter
MLNKSYNKGEKITIICIIGNILLSLFKLFAGIYGNSKAMISDALHSASDIVATVVVYIGIKIAKKPIDEDHPYGHGKIEPISAALVGIILIFAVVVILRGIILSIIRHSFSTPSYIAILGALLSIVVKEIMFRVTLKEGKKINSISIIANAWDHRSDVYSSMGTFIGITGSIVGNHFNISFLEYLDPLAGVVVGCMILKVAYDILNHSIKGLMDSSPDMSKIRNIEKSVLDINGVLSVSWVKARYIGQHLFVDMGIGVNSNLTVKEGHDISVLVKERVLNDVKDVFEVLVHIDPV